MLSGQGPNLGHYLIWYFNEKEDIYYIYIYIYDIIYIIYIEIMPSTFQNIGWAPTTGNTHYELIPISFLWAFPILNLSLIQDFLLLKDCDFQWMPAWPLSRFWQMILLI